jgi:hypothetical protein
MDSINSRNEASACAKSSKKTPECDDFSDFAFASRSDRDTLPKSTSALNHSKTRLLYTSSSQNLAFPTTSFQ